MAENKTQPTAASVDAYLDARATPAQRADCDALMALCARVTGQPPVMWGPSIVGYGAYRYTYASGRTGEMPLVGFAIRGRDLVLYLDADSDEQKALRARLGPHTMGKSCLYVKRLADVDTTVLEQIVTDSVRAATDRDGASA